MAVLARRRPASDLPAERVRSRARLPARRALAAVQGRRRAGAARIRPMLLFGPDAPLRPPLGPAVDRRRRSRAKTSRSHSACVEAGQLRRWFSPATSRSTRRSGWRAEVIRERGRAAPRRSSRRFRPPPQAADREALPRQPAGRRADGHRAVAAGAAAPADGFLRVAARRRRSGAEAASDAAEPQSPGGQGVLLRGLLEPEIFYSRGADLDGGRRRADRTRPKESRDRVRQRAEGHRRQTADHGKRSSRTRR